MLAFITHVLTVYSYYDRVGLSPHNTLFPGVLMKSFSTGWPS